ncbi:hypothetical protein H6F73_01000 [Microcoleus sp. FACHB-68]|nr:hypothetical protein [Microcoleus sp. FACHB-68]
MFVESDATDLSDKQRGTSSDGESRLSSHSKDSTALISHSVRVLTCSSDSGRVSAVRRCVRQPK